MINSFLLAFAMYSKIPMPRADWSREKMKYVMVFFPLIGAVKQERYSRSRHL